MILLLGVVVIKALATVRSRPRLVENRPITTPSSAATSTSARSWPAMPNGAPSSNRSSGHRPAPPTKELVPKGSWRDNRVTRARSGCANWPTKATSPACGSRVGDGHRPCLQLGGVHRLYRRTRTLGSTRASCHDPVLSARGAGRHRLHAWRAHLCGAPGRSRGYWSCCSPALLAALLLRRRPGSVRSTPAKTRPTSATGWSAATGTLARCRVTCAPG